MNRLSDDFTKITLGKKIVWNYNLYYINYPLIASLQLQWEEDEMDKKLCDSEWLNIIIVGIPDVILPEWKVHNCIYLCIKFVHTQININQLIML